MLYLDIKNTGKKEFAKFFAHDYVITHPTKQVVIGFMGAKQILVIMDKDVVTFGGTFGGYIQTSIGYYTASGKQKYIMSTIADYALDVAKTLEVWEAK